MAIRPPRKVAPRAADRGPVALARTAAPVDATPATAEAPTGVGLEEQQREILDLLEASLRTTAPAGDDEDLDFVIAHMRKAVAEANLQPAATGIERTAWVDTLEALARDGLLAREERESLIRQFGEATSQVQNREVQVALELAQRIERDGEQAAMAWLASLRAGDAPAPGAGGAFADQVVLPGKQSITKSRSRRLRGPPGSV
ncbi:hypothetical protein FZO89_06360 [Luteimonas viscosa]|uniref:Uncharacterized protein n=1 Tax=Luteimonas viscosa TaxID=1132694 RepID=A0A5D4XPM2_9GAMM|nr:hypothetical protein [Luteimonas viscosa]TYT25905.1 hypothetical protein FZO89_06360 [Luteimonas viscosa]